MKKPNVFIVGAAKCGTTALNDYLSKHPNVFMAFPKELNYFAKEFPGYRLVDSFNLYLKIFEKSKEKEFIIGDASTGYLHSTNALQEIYKFNKGSKILVMIRNPVDMVYSLHGQLVYSLDETEKDFEKAWRLQKSRSEGKNIPRSCLVPYFLQYRDVGFLSGRIDKLLQIFPQEQVKIIVFDDFIKSPLSIYKDTLSFLGVPYDGRTDFPPVNSSKVSRLEWLTLLLGEKENHFWLNRLWQRFKIELGIEKLPIGKTLMKFNTKKVARKSLPYEFKQELLNEFDEEIDRLSKIVNRDLSQWKKLNIT